MYEGRKIGHYLVEQGETLYFISHRLKIDIETLKKLNHLNDDKIIPGMWIKVFGISTEAPNVVEGNPLPVERVYNPVVKINENPVPVAKAVEAQAKKTKSGEDASEESFIAGKKEVVAEAKPQPQPKRVMPLYEPVSEVSYSDAKPVSEPVESPKSNTISAIPPGAEAKSWIEPGTQKPAYLITEKGAAGKMEGDARQQKKFYATHSLLPKGTIVKVDNPSKKQSVTVEILGRSPVENGIIIRLSEKARAYLMLDEDESASKIEIRYSIPREE